MEFGSFFESTWSGAGDNVIVHQQAHTVRGTPTVLSAADPLSHERHITGFARTHAAQAVFTPKLGSKLRSSIGPYKGPGTSSISRGGNAPSCESSSVGPVGWVATELERARLQHAAHGAAVVGRAASALQLHSVPQLGLLLKLVLHGGGSKDSDA